MIKGANDGLSEDRIQAQHAVAAVRSHAGLGIFTGKREAQCEIKVQGQGPVALWCWCLRKPSF
jgi:hypothetical protein